MSAGGVLDGEQRERGIDGGAEVRAAIYQGGFALSLGDELGECTHIECERRPFEGFTGEYDEAGSVTADVGEQSLQALGCGGCT